MLEKIISGGQTGADRAALDAGMEAGFPVGGYCPAGRVAEDGVIDSRYPLQELDGGYPERTRKNVRVSDGTVVFYDAVLSGGTEQTVIFCNDEHKPCKLIDLSLVDPEDASIIILQFISEYEIRTMNIAGPRQSGSRSVYSYVRNVISGLIE
jgi:hypothetical protein